MLPASPGLICFTISSCITKSVESIIEQRDEPWPIDDRDNPRAFANKTHGVDAIVLAPSQRPRPRFRLTRAFKVRFRQKNDDAEAP